MIPYSDGIAPRRFPVVNVALIVANFAVFLFYELPYGEAAVNHASFYPCDVNSSCHLGVPWGVGWITAMFMHAGWDHILGNMLSWRSSGRTSRTRSGGCAIWSFTSPADSPR